MKQIVWIVLSWFLVMSSIVIASEQPSCSGKSLSEVRTLTALPNEVNSLLGQARAGMDGIADRGAKFNVTDVVDERFPMSRFVIAGINASCVLVAIERGGRAYRIELIVFDHGNGKWQLANSINIYRIPQSLQEMLTYLPSVNK